MKHYYLLSTLMVMGLMASFQACTKTEEFIAKDPDTAEQASIDRFSDLAGNLMKRSASSSLPAANEPIDFDEAPFITRSLTPDGSKVEYYNFDVQPLIPAPIYVLFKEGEDSPVEGQLNIIDVIPGDVGYNDFWQVNKVTVPANYVANAITSYTELMEGEYQTESTSSLVNCPVVPLGSTATKRVGGGTPGLIRGWYKGKVVNYFTFEEKALTATENGWVPVSPIYVTFNINPDENNPLSGPASGFVTETDGVQTHNVVATIPSDEDYSPLWIVSIYDNNDFESVSSLGTVLEATILANGAAIVNCPIVNLF